jgi:nucleoid DNA-binding protein
MFSTLNKYTWKKDNKFKYFGETDTRKKTVRINVAKSKKTKQKGEVLDTINHEAHHVLHPRASEKRVEEMTKKSTPRLSKKSKNKLFNLIKPHVRNQKARVGRAAKKSKSRKSRS